MTLTTETLNDFIAGQGFGVAPSAVEAMARELLASREVQPVLYASEETLAYAKEGEKSLVTWSEPMGDAVIPLFTAPPEPAVPEEAKLGEMPFLGKSERGYVRGWNDCRAAMLAAAPEYDILEDYRAEMLKRVTFGGDGKSSCNANSPEIPEGWKPVPVEPTKEMINAALAAGCASIRSAYREMLAAAPESGNGE